MKQYISLAVFGTFGSPNGFRQSFVGDINGVKTFDLNPNAMQLFAGVEKVYAMRKEVLNGHKIVSFIKYSYASEQGSSRGGTFVGAAVVFANGVDSGEKIIGCLDQLHHNLISNPQNVENGVIMVKHSEEFRLEAPNQYHTLKADDELISDINFGNTDRTIVFYTSLNNLSQLFDKGLDLLNVYDVIYFTDNEEVAKYVRNKNLFELKQEAGGVKEFTALCEKMEEQKRQRQNTELNKVLSWIKDLEKERDSVSERYTKDIEQKQKIHEENQRKIEKGKSDLEKLKQVYAECIRDVKQYADKLNKGRLRLADLSKVLAEIRNRLDNFSSDKKRIPSNVATLQNVSSVTVHPERKRTPIQTVDRVEGNENKIYHRYSESKREIKSNAIKVAVLAIILLLVGIIVYWMSTDNKDFSTENYTTQVGHSDIEEHQNDSLECLDYLSDEDTKAVIDKQFPKEKLPMSIDEVVNRIYKANPTDIGKPFEGKEKEYGVLLIEENKHLFSSDDLLTNTEGMKIPIPKKIKR